MSSKSKKAGSSKPEKPEAGTAAKPKRKHVRKPVLDRAVTQASQLAKKAAALLKNAGRWLSNPNDTDAQRVLLQDLKQDLREVQAEGGAISAIVSALKALKGDSWTPRTAAGGRQPLPVGAEVYLFATRFEPALHGETNAFVVTGHAGAFTMVRSKDDEGAAPVGVLRAWLTQDPSKIAG